MGIIDLLSLDHTNFMIQVAAPQLIQEAPGYEQRTFQKGLEDGTITLERTKRFWQKNHNLVVDDMKRRDPEIAERRQVQPPAAKVYAQGLVDLVLNNAPVPSDLVPETLEFDNARLGDAAHDCIQDCSDGSHPPYCEEFTKTRFANHNGKQKRIASCLFDFTEIAGENPVNY